MSRGKYKPEYALVSILLFKSSSQRKDQKPSPNSTKCLFNLSKLTTVNLNTRHICFNLQTTILKPNSIKKLSITITFASI